MTAVLLSRHRRRDGGDGGVLSERRRASRPCWSPSAWAASWTSCACTPRPTGFRPRSSREPSTVERGRRPRPRATRTRSRTSGGATAAASPSRWTRRRGSSRGTATARTASMRSNAHFVVPQGQAARRARRVARGRDVPLRLGRRAARLLPHVRRLAVLRAALEPGRLGGHRPLPNGRHGARRRGAPLRRRALGGLHRRVGDPRVLEAADDEAAP